jgi:cytochrome c553
MKIKRIFKWAGGILGGIVVLACIGVAIVYVLIGADFSRTFDVALTEIAVPRDEASIDEGERLARLRGCFNGCHGKTLNGNVFFEVPDGSTLVAPDIAALAGNLSAAELERVIRHGVRPDGTSVLLAMPSEMFYNLSDEDVGKIIAFIETQEPGEESLPETRFGPLGRLFLMLYKQDLGTILSAEAVDHGATRLDASAGTPHALGEYIAMTTCTECHGADLRGWPGEDIPSLAIVAAYSLPDFTTLLRTGTPIGGRELDLMAVVANSRFSNFTDDEIAALHAYLGTLVGP